MGKGASIRIGRARKVVAALEFWLGPAVARAAGSTPTVRVEVEVRPFWSVTT